MPLAESRSQHPHRRFAVRPSVRRDDVSLFAAAPPVAFAATLRAEQAARERTLSPASSIAPSVSERCWRSTRDLATLNARRRDLVVARRGRDLFGERYHPSRDERWTAESLRATRQLRCARCAENRGRRRVAILVSAHFRATSRRAADSDSFSETRRGFGSTTFPPNSARRFGGTIDVARHAAWEPGAGPPVPGTGSPRRSTSPPIFIERATRLLGSGRRSLAPRAGETLEIARRWRRSMVDRGRDSTRMPSRTIDAPAVFDAAVYPSLLVAQSTAQFRIPHRPARARRVVHHGRDEFRGPHPGVDRIRLERRRALDSPSAGRAKAFDRCGATALPLADKSFGRPQLGVKCGYNGCVLSSSCSRGTSELARPDVRHEEAVVERSDAASTAARRRCSPVDDRVE